MSFLLNIMDAFFRPCYRWDVSVGKSFNIGRHSFHRQMQYLHFRLTRKYNHIPVTVKVSIDNSSFDMEVIPGKDFHQMTLFMVRMYEGALTNAISKALQKADVFVDVGAYLGYYTLMAKKLNPSLVVLAFEPQRDAFIALQKNLTLNSIEAQLFPFALGNGISEEPFFTHKFPEQSSLLSHKPDEQGAYKVDVKKFDDLFDFKAKHIVVKIDTEGYEPEVMLGMEALLRDNFCTIFFEFNPAIYIKISGIANKGLIEFLEGVGYIVYNMNTKGKLAIYNSKTTDIKSMNLCAIKKE